MVLLRITPPCFLFYIDVFVLRFLMLCPLLWDDLREKLELTDLLSLLLDSLCGSRSIYKDLMSKLAPALLREPDSPLCSEIGYRRLRSLPLESFIIFILSSSRSALSRSIIAFKFILYYSLSFIIAMYSSSDAY